MSAAEALDRTRRAPTRPDGVDPRASALDGVVSMERVTGAAGDGEDEDELLVGLKGLGIDPGKPFSRVRTGGESAAMPPHPGRRPTGC